ncbi:FAD-binding oxidoreductase [Chlorobium phaeovibrioides]|uniref:FAD-binding oxidoreductase n=1 Tax=Chlorobium phaeovibrioides TaxID=1094 RepID=UPI000F83B752|nr:FAD-binding oxidoreductase [Chlorobium phaeovibrioides]RTY33691.1 FAD-binding oxidoreductase [Chlorobium phaeovibrioides]
MKMHGWGRYPVIDAEVYAPGSLDDLKTMCATTAAGMTPRGLGRSYGDSSLGEQMLSSRRLNHFLAFDAATGVLQSEAGVSLSDILQVFIPKGWFLPVTPGTQFVTIGGAIASDVHGKNHHVAGCFCDHVAHLDILLDAERIIRCSPQEHPDLFHATCGGMGLTGMIISAAIRLKPIKSAFIDQTTFKARNLEESLDLFNIHASAPYSVAWIDCITGGPSLGRSLLMTGDHTTEGPLTLNTKARIGLPLDMPSILLNRYSIQAFNTLYYNRITKDAVQSHVHYEPFFYPLDSINDWNRMYGKNGFTQYQFAVPKDAGRNAMDAILKTIVDAGKGSFLAVLKAFGKQNNNLLSFPIEGYTLALDFKIEPELFRLLDRLDSMVLDYGGRIYLTKDARMSPATFRIGYKELEAFQAVRNTYRTAGMFRSHQSLRLGLD